MSGKSYLSVNTRGALRKLDKVQQEVGRLSEASMKDITQMGKLYAKAHAPYYTGNVFRAISKRSYKTKDGAVGKIYVDYKKLSSKNKRGRFNIVRWMHATNGVFQSYNPAMGSTPYHIKSGDPRFLITTREYLERNARKVVSGRFKQIKVK